MSALNWVAAQAAAPREAVREEDCSNVAVMAEAKARLAAPAEEYSPSEGVGAESPAAARRYWVAGVSPARHPAHECR